MSSEVIKTIASSVPTSIEELGALGVLGEQKLQEYGSRLVRQINKFVEDEGLDGYIKKRPKRAKLSQSSNSTSKGRKGKPIETKPKPKEVIMLDDDDDDEFGCDIDFSAIEEPIG